jgi:hypothetical protein
MKYKQEKIAVSALIIIAILLRIQYYFSANPPNLPLFVLAKTIELGIILTAYAIAKKITKNPLAALFTLALAVSLPIYTWKLVAQINHTLAVFFFTLTLYILISLKKPESWRSALIVPFIFSLIHVYSLILLPIFLLFFILAKIEGKTLSKREKYFMIFSSLLILAVLIAYTATPATILVVSQYLKTKYYTTEAENFTLIKALAFAGLLPIYFGIYGAYEGIKRKRKSILLLISAAGILPVVMAFNIVPFAIGIPYLTFPLAACAAFAFEEIHRNLKISKFKNKEAAVLYLIFTLVLVFNILHWIFLNV